MKTRSIKAIYWMSLVVYGLLAVITSFAHSQWLLDNIASILLISAIFFYSGRLKLTAVGFILFDIALLSHNLGFYFYYGPIWANYDNIVHLLMSFAAAYIIYNFISKKICVNPEESMLFRKHSSIFIMLSISIVCLLGVAIELTEYAGFVFFAPGEGIFFAGIGDSDKLGSANSQYSDTMTDIMVNILGSVIGAMLAYKISPKEAICKII